MDMVTKLMEKTIKEVRETLLMNKAQAEKEWNVSVERIDQYKQDRAVALLDAMQFFIDSCNDEKE